MSQEFTKFASVYLSDTDETQLLTVPAGESYVVTLTICNQSGTERTYRVAHMDTTGSANNDDWIIYDRTIAANATHQVTGIAVGASEAINVQAGSANSISIVASGLRYY